MEGGNMRRFQILRALSVLITVCVISIVSIGYAQESDAAAQGQLQGEILRVPVGQKMKVEGVILALQNDNLTIRSLGGGVYRVIITDITDIKERKSNPFRGAKKYSKSNLIPGLLVEVKGAGDSTGSIDAREIKFRNDDLLIAKTMDTRVVPVETELNETKVRLTETEQNAQRLSGQIQELAVVSAEARGDAKAAQESADNAMNEANSAKAAANDAQAGVTAANQRITSLDEYSVKTEAFVQFAAGSAALSSEASAELDDFGMLAEGETAFLIEVAGYASSDGDVKLNRVLSKRRADTVIQYLAEHFSIPLRRFLTPMGYGESRPVGDNDTRAGRQMNRRVEVRLLVNEGLTQSDNTMEGDSGASE
jgi:outer membrane protein OmpA-like peptidoglycan-associated protein